MKYMGKKRTVKGQYGYIKKQKIWTSVRSALLYALSLSIFLIGIWVMGTKENLLTIIAVLGCLPAGRSTVNMIMFLRARGCSEEARAKISACSVGLTQLYDMFFTSYDKNYPISHMVIKNHVVCGYSESKKMDGRACEKHLDAHLKQGGCKGVAVKIFDDIESYCEGLQNLQKQEENMSQPSDGQEAQMQEILENLLSIAL